MQITNVAIEKLKPSEHQPPERIKDVASLAESIKAIGVLNAITVRESGKGSLEIIAGHRRFAAAKLAGLKEIPCVVLPVDIDQAQIIRITENVHRVNLTPMQEAANIQTLLDRKWDFSKIAAELGMTPQYLARRAKLLDLSPEWLKALQNPKKEYRNWPVQLLELVARYSHSRQVDFLEEWPWDVPTIEEVKRFIADGEHELKLAAWDLHDEVLLPKAGSCSACPKRSGCQPLLFDELAGDKKVASGDRCLDTDCWEQKRHAHVQRAEAKALKEHKTVTRVSVEQKSWQIHSAGLKGVVGCDTYKTVKQTDKGAMPALPVDGPNAEQVIWITKNASGVVTRVKTPAQKAKGAKPQITDAERKQRLLNRRNMHIIQQILDHINKSKAPDGLLKMKADEQIKRAFCATMTFGFQNVVHGGSWLSFERACAADSSALIPDWWKRYKQELHRVVVCYNGDEASQRVKSIQPLLDILGLSRDELQKKAAGDIPDHHGLLSGKKPEPKVAKGATAKLRSGTCRECGCTESSPCLIMPSMKPCSWANRSKTLCSICANKKKPAKPSAKPKKIVASKKSSTKYQTTPSFMAPVQPSAELAAIVGDKPIPRTEITKKFWAYIVKHGLQDKTNRRMINADEKLQAVFGGKKQVSMFDMSKLIANHFSPVRESKHGK